MSVMQKVYETFELLPMLLVGIVGGLLGSLFNFLNEKLTVWRKQNMTHSRQKLWDVAAVAVLSATLSFLLPLTVPCRVCPTSSQQSIPSDCAAAPCRKCSLNFDQPM